MTITIRTRLTLLYALVLGASFLAFFWICDLGFRRSIETTVNDESRSNLETVRRVVVDSAPRGRETLLKELQELSALWANGAIFQVASVNGEMIFQAPPFSSPDIPFPPLSEGTSFFTRNLLHSQYRIARQQIELHGENFLLETAAPTEPFDQALDRFRIIEKEFLPLLVLVASLLGYWLSGRALTPVNRIIASAERIGLYNLHRRLEVPRAKDELRRLTETLNAMLSRIELSVQRISQFTADASHDLRTPLALIRTNAELALRKTRTEAEYREALRRILDSSEETTQLIEHLLTLARADAGAAQLKFEPLRLPQIVERACQQARVLAFARNLTFIVEWQDKETFPYVFGDAPALERLFMTVLDNAVKYTPTPGRIVVRTRTESGHAILEVEDTGMGIAECELPKIFDRFYRADLARSRAIRGSGLGLSIARWIAEMHRGTIEAKSKLGEGSRFQIRLPIVSEISVEPGVPANSRTFSASAT
jgi:heavy metal sensor kinase